MNIAKSCLSKIPCSMGNRTLWSIGHLRLPNVAAVEFIQISNIHCGSPLEAYQKHSGPKKWLDYNKKIFPPQGPEEERRPAVSIRISSVAPQVFLYKCYL